MGDIRGRVFVEGGDTFQDDGDTVIFHNSQGPNLSAGLVTNRKIPRMESIGGNQFRQELDSSGDPINDYVVSVEGLGFDIPTDGFIGRDGVKTFGVSLKGIENLDLRLADTKEDDTTLSLIHI